MAVSSIAAFWAVAALLIAVPGADWAFVIGAAVRSRAVLPAVGGLIVGYSGITVAVAAGVGALVAGSAAILTGLTLVGGAYLVWHGVLTFTHPARAPEAGETKPDQGEPPGTVQSGKAPRPGAASTGPSPASAAAPRKATAAVAEPQTATAAGTDAADGTSTQAPATAEPARRVLLQGIGVSGLNPKGLLIFLALLPQFTDRNGHLPLAGQMAALGLVFILTCAAFYLVLGTLVRTTLYARPGFAPKISRVAGAAMVVIGVALIVQRLTGRA